MCWIASQDIILMPDGLWALDCPQERDPAQTLLFTSAEPLLVGRLSLTYQHHAKLDCSGRGAAIPSLSWSLAWPQAFLPLVSGRYNEPPGDWPPDSPQGGPARPERGHGNRGLWSGGTMLLRRLVQGCWLWVLTLARSPPVGSGLDLRRARSPAENRGWAAIHRGWTRSCVRFSADHRGPSRSAGQAPAAGQRSENESIHAH